MSWFEQVVVDDEYVIIPMDSVVNPGGHVEEYDV